MLKYVNTKDAAKLLGISVHKLSRAVWDGRIPSPPHGPGRAFLWDIATLRRASWVLLHRDLPATVENEVAL